MKGRKINEKKNIVRTPCGCNAHCPYSLRRLNDAINIRIDRSRVDRSRVERPCVNRSRIDCSRIERSRVDRSRNGRPEMDR